MVLNLNTIKMKTTIKEMIGYCLTMLQLVVQLVRNSIQTNEVILGGQKTIPDHNAVKTSIKSFYQTIMDVLDEMKNKYQDTFFQKRIFHISEIGNHYG